MTQPRIVVLTGASSGIGAEMARLLAARGDRLILVARRRERLQALADELNQSFPESCTAFPADLGREDDLERLIAAHPRADVLINNAGSALYGYFQELDWEKTRDMTMVNVFAPLRLCHHYLVGMRARNSGRILNVASTAGSFATPFFSAYTAGKSFVILLSKSLALELKGTPITVSCLLPGPTVTEFWQAAAMEAKVAANLKKFDDPRAVAAYGLELMEKGRPFGIPGWGNRVKQFIKQCLPEPLWNRMIYDHMMHPSLTGSGRRSKAS